MQITISYLTVLIITWKAGIGKEDDDPKYRAIWTKESSLSDRSLKKNIQLLPNALEKITQLKGISYQWNEKALAHKTKDVETLVCSQSNTPEDNEKIWDQEKQRIREANRGTYKGFIAQDLEQVFPEWVGEQDGYKTIKIDELNVVLVEAVKELHQEVLALKTELAQLRR